MWWLNQQRGWWAQVRMVLAFQSPKFRSLCKQKLTYLLYVEEFFRGNYIMCEKLWSWGGGNIKQGKSRKLQHNIYILSPRSSDPCYIVSYYTKWVTTSWIHSIIYPCDELQAEMSEEEEARRNLDKQIREKKLKIRKIKRELRQYRDQKFK